MNSENAKATQENEAALKIFRVYESLLIYGDATWKDSAGLSLADHKDFDILIKLQHKTENPTLVPTIEMRSNPERGLAYFYTQGKKDEIAGSGPESGSGSHYVVGKPKFVARSSNYVKLNLDNARIQTSLKEANSSKYGKLFTSIKTIKNSLEKKAGPVVMRIHKKGIPYWYNTDTQEHTFNQPVDTYSLTAPWIQVLSKKTQKPKWVDKEKKIQVSVMPDAFAKGLGIPFLKRTLKASNGSSSAPSSLGPFAVVSAPLPSAPAASSADIQYKIDDHSSKIAELRIALQTAVSAQNEAIRDYDLYAKAVRSAREEIAKTIQPTGIFQRQAAYQRIDADAVLKREIDKLGLAYTPTKEDVSEKKKKVDTMVSLLKEKEQELAQFIQLRNEKIKANLIQARKNSSNIGMLAKQLPSTEPKSGWLKNPFKKSRKNREL